MYSLIIGAIDGTMPGERLLEGMDPGPDGYFRPNSDIDVSRLLGLPALFMPEIQDTSKPQIAQVGNIVSLTRSGGTGTSGSSTTTSSRTSRPVVSKRPRPSWGSDEMLSIELTGRS
jgi:hypothetical protein